jgi:hydrogenase maturation protease
MKKSQTAIIGLGNILLRDEGVGIHVVRRLRKCYTFIPDIDLIDRGTLGNDLLTQLDDYERVIIVDAVNLKQKPGFVATIEIWEVLTQISGPLSSHQSGLADLLGSVRLLDVGPSEICIIAIQPASVEPGLDLSEVVVSVCWAAPRSGGLKSLWRSDEGRHIQKRR